MALDKEFKTFVVYVTALKASPGSARMTMHSSRIVQIAGLKQGEAPTKILLEYADYADKFSFNLAMELPENTGINKHAIKLQTCKQLAYGPISSLRPVKLKTLKTYIKTHPKTGFIWPLKSPANASI